MRVRVWIEREETGLSGRVRDVMSLKLVMDGTISIGSQGVDARGYCDSSSSDQILVTRASTDYSTPLLVPLYIGAYV